MIAAAGDPGDRPAGTSASLVREVEVPDDARALATLPRIDYADAFLVDVRSARRRSGEDWARVTLEGVSEESQRKLLRGWAALGLRLDRGGHRASVLGWELRHAGADFALLGADSRIGMPAELLFRPEGGTLLFATFVRQRNPLAKAIWSVVGPAHRRIVPRLLDRAVARRPEEGPP